MKSVYFLAERPYRHDSLQRFFAGFDSFSLSFSLAWDLKYEEKSFKTSLPSKHQAMKQSVQFLFK